MTEMSTVHAVDHTPRSTTDVAVPGPGAHLRCSYGAIGAFRDIAEALGCAVAVMPDAKGLFPKDHPSTSASNVDP
jgi:thiamine pyrophosphate-dependent acetolactate synthase large subunit-like protein